MASKINLEKSESNNVNISSNDRSNRLHNMESDLRKFFDMLDSPSTSFDAESAFDELMKYITSYDRVLYSTISNIIYNCYDNGRKTSDPAGTLLSNLDALVKYTEDSSNIAAKKQNLSGKQTKENVDDTRKIVLKIWDHATLASQQYTVYVKIKIQKKSLKSA